MKITLFSVFFTIFFVNIVLSQEVRRIGKSELATILADPSDKLYVLNFWASWCGPCVNELPGFQEMVSLSDSSRVEFLFISLDFPSDADRVLLPFLKNNNYTFTALLMTDIDYNSWIDIVNPEWQGNIPATLFFNNFRGLNYFISKPLDKPELEKRINSFLLN